jgi:hypothetical protein
MRTKRAAILVILLGAGSRLMAADPQPAATVTPPILMTSPNPTPTPAYVPPNGNGSANGATNATAAPLPPAASGGCAGCGGYCQRGGSCLHRIIEWATYCPKERISCCHSCNSCHYKGVIPLYVFVGQICKEGPGIHATFPPPPCTHGCKGCCAAPAVCASPAAAAVAPVGAAPAAAAAK